MKKSPLVISLLALLLATTLTLPLSAQAQNIAIVNGKSVPKARVDAFIKQIQAQAAAQNSSCRLTSKRGCATRS